MAKRKKSLATIKTAPSRWKVVTKWLQISAVASKNFGDTRSYLSCVYFDFDTTEGSAEIHTESDISTSFVRLDNDGAHEIVGKGTYLMPVAMFSLYMNQMPSDSDIIVEFYDNKCVITNDDPVNSVMFSIPLSSLENKELRPKAESAFPENATSFFCDPLELAASYKFVSSTTASAKDLQESTIALASCALEFHGDFLQVYSLYKSCSESVVTVSDEHGNDIEDFTPARTLTLPHETLSRIAIYDGDILECDIDGKTGAFHIGGDGLHMKITPFSSDKSKSDRLSYDNIMKVFAPSWESLAADFTFNRKKLIQSISRAASTKPKWITFEFNNSTLTVSCISGSTNITPFAEDISVKSRWNTDGQKRVKFGIRPAEALKMFNLLLSNEIFVGVSVAKGEPYALTIHESEEDFNPEDPHDFLLLAVANESRM